MPDPTLLRHVSPLGWEHIVLTGDYDWNSAGRGAHQRPSVEPLSHETPRLALDAASDLRVILRTNLAMTPICTFGPSGPTMVSTAAERPHSAREWADDEVGADPLGLRRSNPCSSSVTSRSRCG